MSFTCDLTSDHHGFLRSILSVWLFLSCATWAAASGFAPPVVYQAGNSPASVFATDVSGDGITDLLVVNNLSNDLSVLIGNADGTFQSAVNYPVGLSPVSIAIGDFNNDAKLDVAVANSGSDNVSVLLGNGDGTFQSAVNYGLGTGTSPGAIMESAFTFSGNEDLAVANSSGGDTGQGNVTILYGNGDGTFQPAINLDTVGKQPVALAPAGVFNAGPAFAALNSATNDVTVFTYDQRGDFNVLGNFPLGGNGPTAISAWQAPAGNLAVTNSLTNNITVLYRTGDTFGHSMTFPVGGTPVAVLEGVFNQNRHSLGLVVANQADSTVSVFAAKEFKPYLRKPITFSTCPSPKSVAIAFIDPHGYEDLVVACSNGVGVMLNTGP